MRKLKKKFLRIGGRKVICLLAVVGTIVLLTSMAMAVMTEQEITPENCPNHAEHDESCGYVETVEGQPCSHEHTEECYVDGELNCQHVHDESCGYVEAVEGHPCEHKCPVCDPADKIEEKIDGKERVYDLNKEAEEHQDVQIQFIPHSDVLSGVVLVTDEQTAEGQPILQELTQEKDYFVENIDEENSVVKLSVEYLDTQKEGVLRFQLQFEGGEQEVLIQVIDTEAQEQEKTDNGIQEADDAGIRQTDESSTPEKVSANSTYEISGEASTIPNDTEYLNIQKVQSGILSLAINLPIGEKGRYIEIRNPLYAVFLLSGFADLPSVDGKIIKANSIQISENGVGGVRLYIADSVDEVLNIQLKYIRQLLSQDQINTLLDIGELPKTGFNVSVYSGSGTNLADVDIGNWSVEKIEGDGIVAAGWSSSAISYDGGNVYKTLKLNFPKNEFTGDEALAELVELKIFVPDPEIISIGSKSSLVSVNGNSYSTIKMAWSEIQSDGKHWWYTVTPVTRATNHFAQKDGAGYSFSIEQRYLGEPKPIDPAILKVPATEITIRKYGRLEMREQEITFSMGNYEERDTFQITTKNAYDAGSLWEPYDAYIGQENRSDTVAAIVNGNGMYGSTFLIGTHQADPTTESYEFPYEIQPTAWFATIRGGNTEIEEIRYETSDGTNHVAKIQDMSSKLTASFDEIPDGERVTKLDVTWKKIWREGIYFDGFLSSIGTDYTCITTDFEYQVPFYYEDGSKIEPKEQSVQVKHKVSSPHFGTVKSISTRIMYRLVAQKCPELIFRNLDYETGSVVARGEKWTDSSILCVRDSKLNSTTAIDPIIRMDISGTEIIGMTHEENVGYKLSGKCTVMPFLAGWDIQYRTKKYGTQTYHIPNDLPEEGLDITLIEEGDRLYGHVAFTKKGIVNGWNGGVEIIKNIEYVDNRETEDGTSLFDPNSNKGSYSYYPTIFFTSSSCSEIAYQSNDPFERKGHISSGKSVRKYEYGLILGSINSGYGNANDIYQGGTGFYTGVMSINLGWYDAQMDREVWKGDGTVPFGEKVTMYIEVKNPEVLYMGGKYEMYIHGRRVSDCDVSYLETTNGKLWLKVGSLSALEEVVSLLSGNGRLMNVSTEMYALPGAQIGIVPAIGDIYLDINADNLMSKYDGTPEKGYIKYDISGLVPDTEGLLEDGDTTSPRLFKVATETSHQILQKVFSGVSIIPGKENAYETISRKVIVYGHEMENIQAMISIGVSNENLKDYEVIIELPKKGKQIAGKSVEDENEVIRTSEFTMDLKNPVSILSNPSGVPMEFRYRLTGSTEWIEENEVVDWQQVDAVKVSALDNLPKYSAINLVLNMRSDQKVKEEDESSYIGGTFSYVSESGVSAQGKCILGEYVSRIYALQGSVWNDKNEDGTMASSEAKAAGITVNVKRLSDDSVVATQMTDTNGNFKFLLYEGKNLYLEIETAAGYRLTRQSVNSDFTATGSDSDFNRETNRLQLPSILANGSYENIGAGIIRLPVLSAPDMTVAEGKQIAGKAAATSDKTSKLLLNYEKSADENIAVVKEGASTSNSTSVGSIGWITGNSLGETTAKVWVENSLGDRVESTYKITVVPDVVDFTLGKNLTSASREDETFVFMIEHQDEDGQTDEVFYQTVKIPAGSQSGSIEIKKVKPGSYRITELDSNWRYSAQGGNVKNITMDDSEESYRVDFTNTKDTDAWISGKTEVTNTMQDTAP